MNILLKGILLFGLNFLDAVLTLFWVRNDVAEEANGLMAHLLELGDMPFLSVKILMGATAMLVFYRFAHFRLARFGVSFSLIIYFALMFVHAFTGIAAFGL